MEAGFQRVAAARAHANNSHSPSVANRKKPDLEHSSSARSQVQPRSAEGIGEHRPAGFRERYEGSVAELGDQAYQHTGEGTECPIGAVGSLSKRPHNQLG